MQVRHLVPVLAAVVFAVAAPLAAGAAASSSSPVSQPTGTIAGTVTGTDGAPVRGACVHISGLSNPPIAHTASDGSYSVTGLTPNSSPVYSYFVDVDASCGTDPLSPDYETFSTYASVTADATTTLNVALTLGGSISGRIVGADGRALKDVCVQVRSHTAFHEVVSVDDGTFIVPGLPASSFTVSFADCSGKLNVQSTYYGDTTDATAATPVVVSTGNTTSLPEQTLQPGGQFALKVTDHDGNPIPGLIVSMAPVVPLESTDVKWVSSGPPDSAGYVHFNDLLTLPYYAYYQYCPWQEPCRTGPVGYFQGKHIGESPTTINVTSETNVMAQDVISVPPLYATTVKVTASPSPATVGGNVLIKAALSNGLGNPFPSGLVTLWENGQPLASGSADTNGVFQASLSSLSVGVHQIEADYDGDGESTPAQGDVTLTVNPASSGGGGSGGGGGGAPAPAPVSGSVPAGGSLSSDPAGTTPDASNPLVVGVTSPNGGTVSIDKSAPDTQLSHYRVLNVGATISAPAASAASPLRLSFQVFDGSLPDGAYASDLTVFRDGAPVAACSKPGVVGPDPCVTSSATSGGVTSIEVLSSHASTWDVEAAQVGRVAGADRVATAAAVAVDSFPSGGAGAVVLARADDYPDALVGAPLAAARNAPLLLTQGASLPKATADALATVLAKGSTVYVLGGSKAVPDSVATQLSDLGYQVTRYAGADRYATAVAVADALGDPGVVLLATGANFPDALAAGPAAAHVQGVVLLTDGGSMPAATNAYLAGHAATVYAVGGPAAKADPDATAVVGADRYATAADLAARLFAGPTLVGLATGTSFPDALSGGAQLARAGGPLLLATPTGLPAATSGYLAAVKTGLTAVHLFGGTNALTDNVTTQLKNAL